MRSPAMNGRSEKDQAREIVRQELFPNVDPWQGDEQYGPPR